MKTICIYHSRDLDGWMSAAIVKKWFIENNKNKKYSIYCLNTKRITGETFPGSSPHYHILREDLVMLGWDYGDKIPDLSEYDKVIMCDVSFPKEEMEKIAKSGIGVSNFIWIDHHISAINDVNTIYFAKTANGVRNADFAACELTWNYFFPNEEMPEIVRLLGGYDSFRYKFTKEDKNRRDVLLSYINDNSRVVSIVEENELGELNYKLGEEQKVLEFQYGARQYIDGYEKAYSWLCNDLRTEGDYSRLIQQSGESVYQYLCTEAKQTYKKAFPIFLDSGLNEKRCKRAFLCVNQERFNPINFGIDYHKEGYDGFACFWYKDGKWAFSLYNDNGEVDCSAIAKQFGGGGHKGASGFVCDDDVFNSIINK